MIADLHFLRPLWLVALLPVCWVLFSLQRRRSDAHIWGGVIADHLLQHLTSRDEVSATLLRPESLLGVVLAFSVFALAGPTWQKEHSPFVEDQAALVVALELSSTMLAQDLQPSRLERARHKIVEILELRKGAHHALIAYAGTAHMVTPFSRDHELLGSLAEAMTPEIMPVEGDAPQEAYALARSLLEKAGMSGAVVLLTDGASAEAALRIAELRKGDGPTLHVLAVAGGPEAIAPPGSPPAPPLMEAPLREIVAAGGGEYLAVTSDNRDVERLVGNVQTAFQSVDAGGGKRWKDMGYYFVPFVALGCLLWFREGWVVSDG